MNTAFYNGVVGIKSSQTGIDITSNNIANINTTAYKASEADFSTIFSSTLNDSSNDAAYSDVGLGSTVDATTTNLSQGSLLASDNEFDMAIEGEGWFGVQNNQGTFYTRDGSFNIDSDGNLVNSDGCCLLGTLGNNISPTTLSQDQLDQFGQVYGSNNSTSNVTPYKISPIDDINLSSVSSQGKIKLPDILYYPPEPTKNITFKANLDPTIQTGIDPDTGDTVEVPNVDHYSTPIIAPDGTKNTVDMTFTKRVPQQQVGSTWDADVQILQKDGTYDPTQTYDPTVYKVDKDTKTVYKILDNKTGVLTFNENGALTSDTIPSLSNEGVPVDLNLGTPLDPNIPNSGYDGVISIKDNKFASSVQYDGQPEGYLTKYAVDQNGEILANFTNGKSVPVAKIGVYHFQNDAGLSKTGGSLYQESSNSGKAMFYQDKDGNFFNNSKISSHNLESSNVSMSNALTELIVMQKTYDANAKSITTSDQMIQKAINMKT